MVCLFTSDTSEHARLDHPSDRAAPPIPGDLCLTKCVHPDVLHMILVSHRGKFWHEFAQSIMTVSKNSFIDSVIIVIHPLFSPTGDYILMQ